MNKQLKSTSMLLGDFDRFVDNRSSVFQIYSPEFFLKILEWHKLFWMKRYESREKKEGVQHRLLFGEILRKLESILRKVEKKALLEGSSYEFFQSFEAHVVKHEQDYVSGGEKRIFYYIESLIPIFISTLIENTSSSPEVHELWDNYFPKAWKITRENILRTQVNVSRSVLGEYLRWSQQRILQARDDNYDFLLDEVTRQLFPTVEPSWWAKILTYLMRPWSEGERMKDLIKNPPKFGYIGRVYSSFDTEQDPMAELAKRMAKFQEETISLALFLFSNRLDRSTLERNIIELKELKFPENSGEDRSRKVYLQLFDIF